MPRKRRAAKRTTPRRGTDHFKQAGSADPAVVEIDRGVEAASQGHRAGAQGADARAGGEEAARGDIDRAAEHTGTAQHRAGGSFGEAGVTVPGVRGKRAHMAAPGFMA